MFVCFVVHDYFVCCLGPKTVVMPQKRPLWLFLAKKLHATRLDGKMSQIWWRPELLQDDGKNWSQKVRPIALQKMHFHNSSVKKCRFFGQNLVQICSFLGILLQLGSFHATLYTHLSTANIPGGINGCSMLMIQGMAKIVNFGGNLAKFM